jgi:probable F420-dependent oxidoreductase
LLNICLNIWGAQELVKGDFRSVIDLIRVADEKGIDQVETPDHILMANPEEYAHGNFPVPIDYPWYEPVTVLAAAASVTTRIRLSQGIMIAALRPAALLAKQLTTLDVISNGRLDVGLGAGWNHAEYSACGVAWENRFAYLAEILGAMRALWAGAPASYDGDRVQFQNVYQYPRPVQKRIPIYLGLTKASDRNFNLIAELADGWHPLEQDPGELEKQIEKLRRAFIARGRDPESVKVKVLLQPFYQKNGEANLEVNLKKVPALKQAGVTCISFAAKSYCRNRDDFGSFLDSIMSVK